MKHRALDLSIPEAHRFIELVESVIVQDDPAVLYYLGGKSRESSTGMTVCCTARYFKPEFSAFILLAQQVD